MTKFSNADVYENKKLPYLKLVVTEDDNPNYIRGMNNQNWKTINYRYAKKDWKLTYDTFSRVVFKVCDDGDVVACLLDVPAMKHCVMSYMHVGQHGDAQMDWCAGLKTATPEQYEDLKAELESLGYLLRVLKRFPNSFSGSHS